VAACRSLFEKHGGPECPPWLAAVSCMWSVLFTAPFNETDAKAKKLGYVVSDPRAAMLMRAWSEIDNRVLTTVFDTRSMAPSHRA
jgi:hypothetical protein